MRRLINLCERLDRQPHPHVIEYFAEENCASFAYALWLAHGKPAQGSIEVISDPNDEVWDGQDEVFTHVVYATPDNALIDVRGVQVADEILDHYHGSFSASYDPQSFWNSSVGMTDDKPLYGDAATVDEALRVIREYPSLYGL